MLGPSQGIFPHAHRSVVCRWQGVLEASVSREVTAQTPNPKPKILRQGDLEARQLRKVIATFRGTVVTQKGAPSPVQWHEQACEHFGLRGLVRIAVRGLVVEVR
jgi:hypothetical protein